MPTVAGGQIGHGDGGLDGVHAAGDGHVVAHLAVHADGLAIAVAGHDAGLQAVGVRLVQYLPDEVVQPLGAQVQHGLADRHERRQLQKAGVDLLEAGGQLLHDLVAQLAPGGLLVAVGVHHHADCAAGVQELDMAQQRVGGLQLVEHGIDDRLRHVHVQVVQRLFRVLGTHGLGQLLVILALPAGQLADAAGR